jgi:CDP-diglyceride synthetase
MLKKRVISGIIIVLFFFGTFFVGKFPFYLIATTIATFAIKEIFAVNKDRSHAKIDFLYFYILPIAYIIFSLIFVAGKLRWECNVAWLISALLATATYDIFAYFFGMNFGNHKIIPKISPNKSWEGTIGGFMGPIIVSTIMGIYFLKLDLCQIFLFAFMLGILAFYGDLLVSWYKRKLQVKDMGCVIPGHGGILDRIDSHLLVLIGTYCFQTFI